MVSADNRTGLYIALPIYFLFITGCAVWAYFRVERMKKQGISDHLAAHYLGGRTFGPIVLAGTVFASFFSGYTVVGVVNEAYVKGWMSLRWMPSSAGIVGFYVLTGLRLRKASIVRNHQTPVDFITDRYQSQVLRYTVATLQILTSVIYVAAQVSALKNTFNSMFGIDPDSPVAVIVMFIIILAFEWAGGLSSVALTDCVQGFLMILSFVSLAAVVKKHFGGWKDLDPATYPKPEFYQTPSADSQWGFWQFSLLNISFFILPHLMQRIYSARDLKSLRFAWLIMTGAPWATLFVSVFLGTVGVSILGGADVTSPFSSILEAIMDQGGYAEAAGVIAFTASLAAIMSTADSLIIAISQLVTTEIVYPLRPKSTPNQMAWAGRMVSLVTVVFSLLIGLYWKEGITDLGKIQFPLTLQGAPAFIWGLYASERYDAHPWCIAGGAIISSLYVIFIYFLYIARHPDPAPIEAGVTGFCIQLFVIVVLESIRRLMPRRQRSSGEEKEPVHDGVQVIYGGRPLWDLPHLQRFGDKALTPRLLRKLMQGVKEAITNIWYTIFILFALSITTPLVPEFEPPLQADGTFAWLPAVVNGLPWWSFKVILFSIVPYLMLFAVVCTLPDEYPHDEIDIAKHGFDPNVVELTPKELGHRVSYDTRNEYVHARRETITKSMVELGIKDPGATDGEDDEALESITPGQRRLSSLVLGRKIVEEGKDDTMMMDAITAAKIVAASDQEEAPESANIVSASN